MLQHTPVWGHLEMAVPLISAMHFKNEVSASHWEQEGTNAGE